VAELTSGAYRSMTRARPAGEARPGHQDQEHRADELADDEQRAAAAAVADGARRPVPNSAEHGERPGFSARGEGDTKWAGGRSRERAGSSRSDRLCTTASPIRSRTLRCRSRRFLAGFELDLDQSRRTTARGAEHGRLGGFSEAVSVTTEHR